MHSLSIGNIIRYTDVNLWDHKSSGGIITQIQNNTIMVRWSKNQSPVEEWAPNLQIDPRGNFRGLSIENEPAVS